MKHSELKQIIREEIHKVLNENETQKWKISFQTPANLDGEYWISIGKNENEAVVNLKKYFTEKKYGKNQLIWYDTQIHLYDGDLEPYNGASY